MYITRTRKPEPGYLNLSIVSYVFAPRVLCSSTVADIGVIHAQKVKLPHNNTKHANKCAIHDIILRFTPQFHDSRHKETADQSRSH